MPRCACSCTTTCCLTTLMPDRLKRCVFIFFFLPAHSPLVHTGVCSTSCMARTTQSTASLTTQTFQQSALWVVTGQGATSTSARRQTASACRCDAHALFDMQQPVQRMVAVYDVHAPTLFTRMSAVISFLLSHRVGVGVSAVCCYNSFLLLQLFPNVRGCVCVLSAHLSLSLFSTFNTRSATLVPRTTQSSCQMLTLTPPSRP